MKINDFLLCTFDGDNETPKTTYVANILDIDTANGNFECELVDTNQRMKFQFNLSGMWPGTDVLDGTNYNIDTHFIYSPNPSSTGVDELAVVTFADNTRYLCYVESIDDNNNVQFYHHPYPRMSISINNRITFSEWDQYPLGDNISSIEACLLADDVSPASISNQPKSTADWPSKPDFIRQYKKREKEDEFWKFRYEAAPEKSGGDGIRILDNWVRENIIKVQPPVLFQKSIIRESTKKQYTEKNCGLEFHKKGADQFKQLWKDWEDAGLIDRIIDCSLPFVQRFIRKTQNRNPRPLSNHAWGTAFDINVKWNKLGKVPALLGEEGCVRELVALANKNGFFWGGHFGGGRADGMHFELGKII